MTRQKESDVVIFASTEQNYRHKIDKSKHAPLVRKSVNWWFAEDMPVLDHMAPPDKQQNGPCDLHPAENQIHWKNSDRQAEPTHAGVFSDQCGSLLIADESLFHKF